MPGIRVVAIRAPKQTAGDEQHDTQAGPVVARCRFIGMAITEGAFLIVLEQVFVRRIGREPDAQVMPAACLQRLLRRHRTSPVQIWPWKVRLITSLCCSGVRRTKLTA